MSKIKILVVPPDRYGVGKFRMLDPFKYIGENHSEDVHVDLVFNLENRDELFDGYDIVIFHSFIHQTTHKENIDRINWLKSKGVKVIMDIDDMWFVDQRHPMYHQIKQSGMGEMKIEMLKLVDYVSTTTPIFANTIKERLKVKMLRYFQTQLMMKKYNFNQIRINQIKLGLVG